MPIYEFRCDACDTLFEQILPIGAASTRSCPECGERARRLISRSSFQLKGSGWYLTDYKSRDSGGKGGEVGEKDSKRGTTRASGATGS